MPEVVGQKSQPQGRDEDVVDLIFRVHGTGAGDDVVAPGQCFGPDEFQQQAGDRPVIIPEYHIPVGQRFHRAPVEYHPLGVMAESSRSSSLAVPSVREAAGCRDA